MTEQAELIKENIEAYKAMAADTEREQEACEWCNAYFGHAMIMSETALSKDWDTPEEDEAWAGL
jgi:hypothetical protein